MSHSEAQSLCPLLSGIGDGRRPAACEIAPTGESRALLVLREAEKVSETSSMHQ